MKTVQKKQGIILDLHNKQQASFTENDFVYIL
jgi:hypothetical protein